MEVRGEEEGGGLKGTVYSNLYLSACCPPYQLSVCLPSSMSDSRHTVARCCKLSRWHVSHSDATSLLWSYCLNDSLFSLTSAGRAHRYSTHTFYGVYPEVEYYAALSSLLWVQLTARATSTKIFLISTKKPSITKGSAKCHNTTREKPVTLCKTCHA